MRCADCGTPFRVFCICHAIVITQACGSGRRFAGYCIGERDRSGLELSVYANAHYTAASNDRRSVSDIVVMLGDTAIRWRSSTQKCMTTATGEAQYTLPCVMRQRRRSS